METVNFMEILISLRTQCYQTEKLFLRTPCASSPMNDKRWQASPGLAAVPSHEPVKPLKLCFYRLSYMDAYWWCHFVGINT